MELDRLTTDNPQRNIEVLLNYAYAENGRVKLRSAGGEEDVDLCEYIEQQRRELDFGCGVDASDVMDGACMLECDCPLAVLNVVAIQAAELRGKLACYEDLEERGQLVVLPCKVGDTVYIIGGKYRAGRFEWWINTGKFRLSDLEKIGKTVFLTREEAEAALREMEG